MASPTFPIPSNIFFVQEIKEETSIKKPLINEYGDEKHMKKKDYETFMLRSEQFNIQNQYFTLRKL